MRSPARLLSMVSVVVLTACAGMGGPPQSAYQVPPNLRAQPQARNPLPPGLDLARSRPS